MDKIKSFFVKIGQWFKKTFSKFWKWAMANKLIAGIIAGGAVVVLTLAIVLPISITSANKKKAANQNAGGDGATFTVVWKNGDTILETDKNVKFGSIPVYNGSDPTKADDEEFTYEWSGWSPSVVQVTADATYVATFTQHDKGAAKKHTIDDDATLQTANRLRSTNFTTKLTKEGTANYYEVKALGSSLRNINFNTKYDAINGTEHYVAWCKKAMFGDMNPDWIGYKHTNKWIRTETMSSADMFSSEYYLDKGVGLYFDYIFTISHLSELVYVDSEQVYTKAISFKGAGGYLKLRYDDNVLVKATISTTEGSYTQTFTKYGTTQVSDWMGLTEFQQSEQINQNKLNDLINPEYSSTADRLLHASYDYSAKFKQGMSEKGKATGSVKSQYSGGKLHYIVSDNRFDGLLYYNGDGNGLKISWNTSAPYSFTTPTSSEQSKAKYDPYEYTVRGYFAIVVQNLLEEIVGLAVESEFHSEDYVAYAKYVYNQTVDVDADENVNVFVEAHYTIVDSVVSLSSLKLTRDIRYGYVVEEDVIEISNISFGDASILSNSDYSGI